MIIATSSSKQDQSELCSQKKQTKIKQSIDQYNMNQFKELREKKISKQKRIKDDAMIYANKETQNSLILQKMQSDIYKASDAEKNKLMHEMNQSKRTLRNHFFHSVYNRKYNDTLNYDKIKLIIDYDFPLK